MHHIIDFGINKNEQIVTYEICIGLEIAQIIFCIAP